MKTRTFIAIEASAEICSRAKDLIDLLAPHTNNVRWVQEATLHYTLCFLGDITDQDIVDVCRRVETVADRTEPFGLQASGLGAFPSADRPRTLWIGAGAGCDALGSFQNEIDKALNDLGFRGENRRYVPHLTIGKTNRTARDAAELAPKLAELATYDAGVMAVSEAVVFASELTPNGPEYHALARCPLRG